MIRQLIYVVRLTIRYQRIVKIGRSFIFLFIHLSKPTLFLTILFINSECNLETPKGVFDVQFRDHFEI